MGFMDSLSKAFRLGATAHQVPFQEGSNDIMKSEPVQGSKSIIEDPLALVQALGYKDKPNSLTYETLANMSTRDSVISAIVLTRVNQISAFSQPARFTRDGIGFEITLRDPKAAPTADQKKIILSLEMFLENCGYTYDPGRDSFDTFLRKFVRDSLTYDQGTFEIVPDRIGRPAEFYATDAATIRAATLETRPGEDFITSDQVTDYNWVQLINGQAAITFSSSELAFCVRNPRTDINVQPYGFSELEVLIHQITSHLWAEEYNSRYFSQGGTTKGILNLKGTNISKEQLDAFRRQWTAQVAGMTGAWKTPVVSVEGLEYINVSQSNREMEYEMWMNYLINICCAVYQIDPSEVNFPNRGGAGGGGGGGLGDGGIEERLKNSRDKGLRPLLRFIESMINRHIIYRFSRDYTFNFIGLDQETEQDRLEISDKQVRTYKTINELRKEKDMDPIDGGDVILDPTYTNWLLQQQQNAMMQQQQGQGDQDDPNAQDAPEIDPEQAQQQGEDQQISGTMDNTYGTS